MKKAIVILLAAMLLLSLAACGLEGTPTTAAPVQQPSSTNGASLESQPSEPATEPTEPATQPTEPIHTHTYTETVVDPTCTDNGYTLYTCDCGDSYTGQETAATGHSYGSWKTTKDATCTENGSKQRSCSCGDTQTKTIAATGHSYGSWQTIKDATCTETGSKQRSCSCGHTQTKTIDATGHSYDSWQTIKDATCTENGTKQRSCSCGDTQTETIAATGHNWMDATCTEARSCGRCGATDGSALGHNDNGSGACSRCGESLKVDMTQVVGAPLTSETGLKGNSFSYNAGSNGWLNFRWYAKNNSGKTIKYFYITIEVYNTVGDLIFRDTSKRQTGPVNPGETFGVEGHWWDLYGEFASAGRVTLTEIKLEFTDGTIMQGDYGYFANDEYFGSILNQLN